MPKDKSSSDGQLQRRSSTGRIPAPPTIRPDQALQAEQLVQKLQSRGTLLVLAGASADIGTHFVIEKSVVVGREAIDGLLLYDGQTSRQHFSIEAADGKHVLRDLGSTNGTIVNGARVSGEHLLADGDKIHAGQTLLKFTIVDGTEAAYLHRMERLAGTDSLTGLIAKHRFDALLADVVSSARAADGMSLAVLMMDMDGLKAINDRHGHQMGAHTIAQVGRLIGEILADTGEACRFGGDEFCAMLPGANLARARDAAEEIRARVERERFELHDVSVQATITIGVAELTPQIESGEQLVAKADQALYRAKGKGRNCVCD